MSDEIRLVFLLFALFFNIVTFWNIRGFKKEIEELEAEIRSQEKDYADLLKEADSM